ncbi:MAG: hypothetical protein Q8P50_17935 [Bacillota bacterium]|nr:hypothetical protein [Bacillota bacterium]
MESKQLFHDGVYPHGFHIILSALRKISAIDPLLVLKFAGPLASLLTVAGAWYCATRLTRSPTAGLVAAFVLGLLPRTLPLDYARQASTNSQEFGMAFVLPVVVLLSRYLDEGDHLDLTTAGAGLAVTGLVHPLPALAAATYTGCCLSAHAICGSLDHRRAKRVIWTGLLAAGVSAAPIAAGLLHGIPLHQSSLAFALSGGNAAGQGLTPVALAAVCCAAGGMVITLFRHARGRSTWDTGARQGPSPKDSLVCLLVTLASLAIWQASRLGLSSLVLSTRGGESGSPGIALGISAGVGSLAPDSPVRRGAGRLVATLVLLGLGMTAWKAGVQPAAAYRMQSDAWVDQYLRIATTHTPHKWMIVGGEEGYALALGAGWHMSLQEFLAAYDPTAMPNLRFVTWALFLLPYRCFAQRRPARRGHPAGITGVPVSREDRLPANAGRSRARFARV